MRSVTVSLIFLAATFVVTGDVVPAEPFRVGAAQVEITPPVGYRRAGGYDEDISQSVVDPLFAKALVFEQGTARAALVVCDLCSIGRQVSDPVRKRASRQSGIPVESITVCMTHTHGGPEYYGTLRDLWHEAAVAKHGRDPHETVDYPALLAERVAEAVQQAAQSARAVRLESGTARLPGIAFNRRFHMRDGSVQFNPGKKNPNIVGPAGPVDEELPMALFRDAQTDKPV
jgi:neutral ceramidase